MKSHTQQRAGTNNLIIGSILNPLPAIIAPSATFYNELLDNQHIFTANNGNYSVVSSHEKEPCTKLSHERISDEPFDDMQSESKISESDIQFASIGLLTVYKIRPEST